MLILKEATGTGYDVMIRYERLLILDEQKDEARCPFAGTLGYTFEAGDQPWNRRIRRRTLFSLARQRTYTLVKVLLPNSIRQNYRNRPSDSTRVHGASANVASCWIRSGLPEYQLPCHLYDKPIRPHQQPKTQTWHPNTFFKFYTINCRLNRDTAPSKHAPKVLKRQKHAKSESFQRIYALFHRIDESVDWWPVQWWGTSLRHVKC